MNPSAIKQFAIKKKKKAQCFNRREELPSSKRKAFVAYVENPSVLVVHSTTGTVLTKTSVRGKRRE